MNTGSAFFLEPHAAATSLKSGWTRLASTYSSIRVKLAGGVLEIRPRWYISALARLLLLDLHHRIPVDAIRAVEETGTWHSHSKVDVTYRRPDGEERTVRLYLRKGRELIDVLEALRGGSSPQPETS